MSARSRAGNETRISFVGARAESEPQGELTSADKGIYYIGSADAWRMATRYARVRYVNVYPGIDLVFVTAGTQLEYNFEIAPHANPKVIRISVEGSALKRTDNGVLEIGPVNAAIAQMRPLAYQAGVRRNRLVNCEYVLKNEHEAILRLAAYDASSPLYVDPVLNFSTYLGGSGFDSINAAVSDGQGDLFITGETSSGSLSNPAISARSSRDAFIAKLSSGGAHLSVVYLGGSNYDSGRGIALDSSGNIYVTGVTSSSDFPVTPGAFARVAPGAQDAFVAKFNSSMVLQYSTYLGGGSGDSGLAIAVDSAGDAYVAGQTQSTGFPVSSGAFQKSNGGGISDCFISKLNPAGSALLYSTYLGGSGLDLCAGIALDTADNAYVAGTTYSANFPVVGPLQSSLLGTATAFVTKLNAAGSAIVYSTYLGGSNLDNATALALDSSDAAYVTGDTASIDFPTTTGAFQGELNGFYNAFVSKLSASGSTLVYSTFLGGSGSDVGSSIAIDTRGRAIVGGYTSSSNFPTSSPVGATFQGVFDAFATVVDPVGATLFFSSFFGGAGDDRGYAVAAAPPSILYLAGITSSTNFPVSSPLEASLSVPPDAFALEVAYSPTGVPGAVSVTPSSGSGLSQTFSFEYSDTTGASSLEQVNAWFTATLASAVNSCQVYYQPSTNQVNLLNNAGTVWMSGTPGASGTLQNSQCSLNLASTTVSLNGNNLTLNLPVTFQAAYAGAKGIYLYAEDVSGAVTGWEELGAWTVPSGTVTVSAVSVTPSSGSGLSQTFAFQYSDSAGAASLAAVYAWFTSTFPTATNSCLLYYNAPANQINLLNAAGAAYTSATLGTSSTLQNGECSVNVAAASVTKNGNTLTLNLPITFLVAFAGAKSTYLFATDASGASTSAWEPLGSWIVQTGTVVTVTAVSVTPSSGSGLSQTFSFQYSDTAGAGSLSIAYAWFTATFPTATNTCLLYYSPSNNQLNLLNDGGSAYESATLGTANTLQNSQCSVNAASASATKNGNTLTLNLPITFLMAFAGTKGAYLFASDTSGANTGAWQELGTWTIQQNGAVTVTAVSVTPSSGSGLSQTFVFQYSDSYGTARFTATYAWFTATFPTASNSCLLYYNPAANQINLLNDSGGAFTSATVGSATTLQNSQCSLNVAAASTSENGNTSMLSLPLTFQAAFAGAKNTYLFATDASGVNTGWQQLGTWTVP